jgi:cytochrome c oxidase subunit II
LLGVAIVRARRRAPIRDREDGSDHGPAPRHEARATGFVLIGGGLIPALILIVATVMTLTGLAVFDRPPDGVEHTITVRGHMFWWEVEYPEHGVVTANEIHVPVGQPVRVELESADVIHSFWVPQLHGKLEMIPGKTNVIYMEADTAGTYFGKCAEFCGPQHANMEFLFIAQDQSEFEAWLAAQAADAVEPADDDAMRGRDVFVESPCALCHTIRGVSTAAAEAGPDLTHLASRRTLAARTLVNVRGNLAGWILDPQGIKPGSQMPAVNLGSDDFHALLAFLEGLQ